MLRLERSGKEYTDNTRSASMRKQEQDRVMETPLVAPYCTPMTAPKQVYRRSLRFPSWERR